MKKSARGAAAPPALLAAALDAQGDGVVISRWVPGEPPTIVSANPALLAMTGHTLAAIVGRPHRDLHGDRVDIASLERPPAPDAANGAVMGEGPILRADGGTRYAAWSVAWIRKPAGEPTHVVVSYRDTTEKRRLQEALVHAQRLDAVGRLAGGIAHDFNNLLSVINGYCEMLNAELSDDPTALRQVKEIHRAGLRASALTRQLLAFGRRTPMDPQVVDLNRLVREHAEILQRLLGSAGRLELELAPSLPRVRTDPTQFQQVLLNLVLNARDALRDNGCVTIRTREREMKVATDRGGSVVIPPGRYVAIIVSDNGTGMDAETQKHLFEPFFTTKPEGKGTGLGLALVYGVVQQSSGYISVRSALLAGSTFEILLPHVEAPEQPAAEPEATSPLRTNHGHESLLVVEADVVVRKMVAGMLTASGYRVVAAKSPAEAVALADASDARAQLVVVPHTPEGEQFVQALQASGTRPRVLWVAANEEASASWLPAGEQAAISKPFALSEILRAVRALLDA